MLGLFLLYFKLISLLYFTELARRGGYFHFISTVFPFSIFRFYFNSLQVPLPHPNTFSIQEFQFP